MASAERLSHRQPLGIVILFFEYLVKFAQAIQEMRFDARALYTSLRAGQIAPVDSHTFEYSFCSLPRLNRVQRHEPLPMLCTKHTLTIRWLPRRLLGNMPGIAASAIASKAEHQLLLPLRSEADRQRPAQNTTMSDKCPWPSFLGYFVGIPQLKFVSRQSKVGFRLEVEIRAGRSDTVYCWDERFRKGYIDLAFALMLNDRSLDFA